MVALAATVLTAGVAANLRSGSDLAWRGLLIFLGALGSLLALPWLQRTGDPLLPGPPGRRPARAEIPPSLVRTEDAVRAGCVSRADFERALRPLLYEIAEDRLLAAGVSPERDPGAAGERLGEPGRELLLAPRTAVYGTARRGPSRAVLEQLLDRLEALRR